MLRLNLIAALAALIGSASLPAMAESDSVSVTEERGRVFEVSITNITRGQTFTPILVATHSAKISLFSLGAPAGDGLAFLAEDGNTAPLASELVSSGEVLDAQTIPGLLAPGATATVRVRARGRFARLSVAAMLIPTNDNFVALNSLALPWSGGPVMQLLLGYDAGSEPNDELCANIPGPRCGGQGASPGVGGEGYVFVGNGMHGIGDLSAAVYDWRNPVARLVVRRID
jgi:Spondin_N